MHFGGRKSLSAVVCIAAALVIAGAVFSAALPSMEELTSVVPGSVDFRHKTTPVDHYIMTDAGNNAVGVAFLTTAIPPKVAGYGREIDCLIGMDAQGQITGVKVLGHSETMTFFDRILKSGFLDKFVGRVDGGRFDDIDTVTGATVSTEAMKRDITLASAEVVEKVLKGGRLKMTPAGHPVSLVIRISAVFLLTMLSLTAVKFPSRKLRIFIKTAAFAVLGLWLNVLVTIGDVAGLTRLTAVNFANLPLLYLMAFAFTAALFKGNLYCIYLCPFGAMQDVCSAIKAPKCRPNTALHRRARRLRWAVTFAALAGILIFGVPAFGVIEPFSLLFMRYPDVVTLVQAGVILAASVFASRVWCRFFCPTGLCLDAAARSGLGIRRLLIRNGQ